MKPLWAMADPEPGLDLPTLPVFVETATHGTYGRYGSIGRSRLNKATADAIRMAHALAGQPCEFSQGGLNTAGGTPSASTHSGLGVADTRTSPIGITLAEARQIVSFGMDCGAIGFMRGMGGPDRMVPHIHWVMVGMRATQHKSTEDQIYADRWGYINGGGGLGGARSARWWGPPRKPLVTWAHSRYNPGT